MSESGVDHILERRAKLLSGKLQRRKELVRMAVAPPGQRPPFSKQLSQPDALRWWKLHRFDDLGQRILSNMTPESIMELDQALSRQNEVEMYGPQGVVGAKGAVDTVGGAQEWPEEV